MIDQPLSGAFHLDSKYKCLDCILWFIAAFGAKKYVIAWCTPISSNFHGSDVVGDMASFALNRAWNDEFTTCFAMACSLRLLVYSLFPLNETFYFVFPITSRSLSWVVIALLECSGGTLIFLLRSR